MMKSDRVNANKNTKKLFWIVYKKSKNRKNDNFLIGKFIISIL